MCKKRCGSVAHTGWWGGPRFDSSTPGSKVGSPEPGRHFLPVPFLVSLYEKQTSWVISGRCWKEATGEVHQLLGQVWECRSALAGLNRVQRTAPANCGLLHCQKGWTDPQARPRGGGGGGGRVSISLSSPRACWALQAGFTAAWRCP